MTERLHAAIRLALLVVFAVACAKTAPPVRVVLVTIDTLRWDGFASGAAEPSRIPFTWSWATRGQIFSNFYASTSVTQPTHASLFTGLAPWEHGVTRNGQVLADGFVTVAERFREAGFETAAVIASYPLDARFGFSQGFDRYAAEFEQDLGESWEGMDLEGRPFYALADQVTERAIGWLDASTSRKQFLWVHYFDPHAPYGDSSSTGLPIGWLYQAAERDPERLVELLEKARQLYDRDLTSLDAALTRLLTRLDGADGDWTTHVVFTADHGESFGEHGSLGHGSRVTPEQVHVPLFIVSPGLRPATRTAPAGSADVAATLLSLASVDRGPVPGRDLTLVPEGPSLVLGMRRTLAAPGPEYERRTDGSDVSLDPLRFFAVLDGSLYAGNADGIERPGLQERPVEDATARRLRSLFGELESWVAATQAEQVLDSTTHEALRALGYVR